MSSLFEPVWLPRNEPEWRHKPDSRFGAGISIGCPVHVGCRLEIWFGNPIDGYGPMGPPGVRLYFREGSGFGDLSLSPKVDMGEHGRFEIIGGKVIFRLQ